MQYAELLLDGTVQLLIPQAEDMILASVTLYNDALSDIPVVMDYRITVNTVIDHLAIAETYIDLVNNEIKVRIFEGYVLLERAVGNQLEVGKIQVG